MCLGVPMKIIRIEGNVARCQYSGIERDVNIFLLAEQGLEPSDFVLVHVGYAIQKVEEKEAETRWQLLDQMQSLN